MGWQPFFQQQLSLDEWHEALPARIVEQHRSRLVVAGAEEEAFAIPVLASMPDLAVGDWVLLDRRRRFLRLLERKSCFLRKSAGSRVDVQRIAANVDRALIVSSLDEDFSLNRIERFLALVNEAGAEPVVVLTKADLVAEPRSYLAQVRALDPMLIAEAVDGRDPADLERLAPWLGPGQTLCVLGSSGVGKSTLVNTLLGHARQETAAVREADRKGRHTTTRRSLLPLPGGSLILDTPGMRELQLAACEEGIAATFADIEALAERCRYGNCGHQAEPGCAVKAAIELGALDARRLANFQKLQRESRLNSASLAERRADDRALGRFYKRTLAQSKHLKGRK